MSNWPPQLSCRDFYAMLVEDFDDFMAEPQSARRAWHCALTAYHLHEWVWGDWLKGNAEMRERLDVNSKQEFLKWIEKNCGWFWYVQQLTNGAKHFVRSPGAQLFLVGGYGEGDYSAGDYGMGYLVIDVGEAPHDEVLPDAFEGDDGNGPPTYQRWQTAAAFLEVVVRFWRDFFRSYLPDPNLPASTHHTM